MPETYQSILTAHLRRRLAMNPRYSLRGFAELTGLSASKLSEILAGKKGLSPARAEDVVLRLKLKDEEKRVFLLSVAAQHARIRKAREEAKHQLAQLLRRPGALGPSGKVKTEQRNAWYFGACKAVKEAGLVGGRLAEALTLTPLQVENAERFVGRIKKLHPERERFAYEPSSVLKKMNEDYSTGALGILEAEFAFLSTVQAEELVQLVRDQICAYAAENRGREDAALRMFVIGHSELCKKEDLC